MDSVGDKFKSSGILSPVSNKLRSYNSKFYSSISVSVLLALTLLQFNLISHVVDSFPSAASKQDQDSRSHPQQATGSLRRPSVAESLMDRIDVDSYLKNTKALKLQFQCIVHDGPCDYVGRWLKPRVRMALLGECNHCSEKTKAQITKIVDYIQSTYPEEFKAGVAKYLLSVGLEISDESKPKDADEEVQIPTISTTTAKNTDVKDGPRTES